MNGHEWMKFIKERRPEYAINRKPLIERFANKGSSRGDFTQFGPIYQIFMYAFILGFHKGDRIPLPKAANERNEFLEIGKWRPEGLVDYIIMLLLSHGTILHEIGLDFNDMEDMDEEIVKSKFTHLIKVMEEYANAGFGIIQERFELNPYFFNDPFAFILLLKEVGDGKLN
ncbi:hypothetical protein GXP67_19660 [Rhodocytophaga rosea]|uniref:DNA phosphorothioation-associated protein 4 n=1 Tax=Rhodocytophaga rosea TaxID=2704465 RepID=A0A6C0GKU3_9BACT|nr:hypothetical protein [Rhodocytophaga rosea]QHT68701.1 hypothetical protein GXP67_19660 [Rhodocytophaga rosea]